MPTDISFASLCVRDPEYRSLNPPHQIPIVPASSFIFDSIEQGMAIFDGREEGHIYGRFGNPTVDAAAAKIAALEAVGTGQPAFGLLTSSGMGAIHVVLAGLLRPGSAVLTQADLYGGTTNLIKDLFGPLGIEYYLTDVRDLERTEDFLRRHPNIEVLYLETPANPTLRCADLAALSELAHRYDCRVVVDNTFATPALQRPLMHGVDIVLHSTTKYLNGHGTGIAGAIVTPDGDLLRERLVPILRLAGPNGNPWDAWLVLNGLKTLDLRMREHCRNATAVAEYLVAHDRITTVNYPTVPGFPDRAIADRQMSGYGGMVSFEVVGGLESGKRFMNQLRFCTLTPTLGDVDTLVLHPATMSHRGVPPDVRLAHGIPDGLIRISVGIETVGDIIADLEQALR
jgi:methionine-gamma-lyase